jgi:hypothetical protein
VGSNPGDPAYGGPGYSGIQPGYGGSGAPGPSAGGAGYAPGPGGFGGPGASGTPGYDPPTDPGFARAGGSGQEDGFRTPGPIPSARPAFDPAEFGSRGRAAPSTGRSDWPLTQRTGEGSYAGYGADDTATTLSFSLDPLNAPLPEPASAPPIPARPAPSPVPEPVNNGRRYDSTRPAVAADESDGDLLIFSQTPRSAWFTLPDDLKDATADTTPAWGRVADDGWRAAGHVAHPSVGADTGAGLPRRVPQANLVPGSVQSPPRQARIVRDAESIAAHTSGYFRGWRRGQEIGGFAVGQRDRAAWEFNRDQRAREAADHRARMS